jgi:class 3 adenylate cyclase
MDGGESALAVLFADVSGSTRLYEKLGNAPALAAVGRCVDLMRTVCEAHGGRIVKTIGDEVMATFAVVDKATEAAAAMQAQIGELAPVEGTRLAIRVGFHVGPAIESAGDVYGDAVNVAARMAALAKAGQVITTAETAAALSPWLRARLRELDRMTVKGKSEDIAIFELLWQDSSDELTALSTRPRLAPARIRLSLGEREIELSDAKPSLTFGRDPQCDVVIADRLASRVHARIERRRDKFVLVDQSSNGTYVAVDNGPEILLRREELILRGRGSISFGHAPSAEAGVALRFACGDVPL